jgi:uncharacterized coiled-coil protein SlyX
MSSTTELVLKLRIIQLEGKLALYESLISDLSNMASIQKVAADIKTKLQSMPPVWGQDYPRESHG